ALLYLFLRRIFVPTIRLISLYQDYFPLFLIAAIAVTGIIMRYYLKVDLLGVKNLMVGLIHLNPVIPRGIGSIFYMHLFLICILAVYFPFSKLMHMPGIFLSPTRNLANNNRARRHINPWNKAVAVHTYEEWEDEFRDKLKSAGYELEKD
ncbi:MAG TPA: respiratory nitrate reductase subunit gamma, partial [Spirochaetota bacterium]|nr:respiratory nitrate reductase subunit gamma [Spirochaetota bacterium]